MIPEILLLGGLGAGAAAGRLIHPRKHSKELKHLQKREKELALQLEGLQTSLQLSRNQSDEVQKARIEQLLKDAEEVKANCETLQREKDDAAAAAACQEQCLRLQLEQARSENARILQEKDEWSAAAQRAHVEKREAIQEVELSEYQGQLDQLRTLVSETMSKLLSHDISERDAVQAVESLGCKVTYIEAPPASSSSENSSLKSEEEKRRAAELEQPQLLLNDLSRLERLVSASRGLPSLPSSSVTEPGALHRSNRLPVVMFPQLKLPTFKVPAPTSESQASQQLASPAHDPSPCQPEGTAANKKWDQTQTKTPANITMGGQPASKKGADQADSKAKQGVTFSYSLQGSKGNQWIAKMPLPGGADAHAGLACFNSDQSPKLGGAPAFPAKPSSTLLGGGCDADDDVGFSSSKQLGLSRP
ncbi:hypothetical protein DUNSADRAFT_11435 [Dunaliella salina]|uniref:Uncharacterized protein n=1 Tax=Dunaliella salina TaxID=3046 RepID=A0ABQ7GDJ4_DUNSA|nr:hypothetical protein DUNSADRAFT_11435 [Dunaliella salina]|eukprot:KAF5832618.1 hypothetical protein DUNSADRAFT_11435 [Dunaliella salina]